MNENPPPHNQVEAVLPQFKYLGIELGKPWKPEDVNPLVLGEMKLAAQEVGSMMDVVGPIVGKPSNGWDIPPANFGATGADYLTRGINSVLWADREHDCGGHLLPWSVGCRREAAEREGSVHHQLQGINSICSGDPSRFLVSDDV